MSAPEDLVREKHRTFDVSTSEKVSAVDTSWLNRVLSRTDGMADLQSSRIIDVIQGGSVKLRVGLEYKDARSDEGLPRTVMVKGGFDRHTGDFGDLVRGVYRSEMLSYRDIIEPTRAKTGGGSPKVYFAGCYPTEDDPIIVMEDLAGKAVFNNALVDIGYDDMRKLIDAVAKRHAVWWNDAALDAPQYAWVEPIYRSSVRGVLDQICEPRLWEKFLLLPRGAATPRPLRDPGKAKAAIDQLASIHERSNKILVHLDCHIGNTYFDEHGDAGFLDWSLYRAPWHHELTYLLVSGLDISDRRRWERALLGYYLNRLEFHGAVDTPSFEEAWLLYRMEFIYGFVLWIGNGDDEGSYQPEPINTAIAQRFAWAALDHDMYGLYDV